MGQKRKRFRIGSTVCCAILLSACTGTLESSAAHAVPEVGRPDGGLPDKDTFWQPEVCATVDVSVSHAVPNVVLIVDQSGSMTEDFDGRSRWDAVRSSLLSQPGGLVFELEESVRFGLVLFTAMAGPDDHAPAGECPMLTTVPMALNNLETIRATYEPVVSPDGNTPTGDSIDAVIDQFVAVSGRPEGPTIFVLATDGAPDQCEDLNPANPLRAQQESIAATQRAFDLGVRTFIIGVGEDTVSTEHLQDMANAGMGHRSGEPDAPYYIADGSTGLRDALRQIVGGVLNCEVTTEGEFDPGLACEGQVTLDGRVLECEGSDGWKALDDHTIQLLGAACDQATLATGTRIEASFPCGVYLI